MGLGCVLGGFSSALRRGIGSERAGDLPGRGEQAGMGRH